MKPVLVREQIGESLREAVLSGDGDLTPTGWAQPGLFCLQVGLFRLIDSFKAFPLIYVLTDGGPGSATEVTNYYAFVQAFNFSYWGYASAIAMVLLTGVFTLSWAAGRLGWNGDEGE